MDPTERQLIHTPVYAMKYLNALRWAGLMYHLEDDPADALEAHNLTPEQIENIRANSRDALNVNWEASAFEDAFDYIIETQD